MSNTTNDCAGCCPAILLLAFNRPDLTRQVFERIRLARPQRLFFAVDGPRIDHPNDLDKCTKVRSIVDSIDWPCDIKTLFHQQNLGCEVAVSTAISWFFSYVENGVILEDDCVPDTTFFYFCDEVLTRYCEDTRVMLIGGNNFQPSCWSSNYSYYYSIYPEVWGWATWRRAWQHFDFNLALWPELRTSNWLMNHLGEESAANYWTKIFDACTNNDVNSWGYRWVYSCWIQNGLTILPSVNLVTNIGFGTDSTHTSNSAHSLANLPTQPMLFPLLHPDYTIRDFAADEHTLRNIFGVQPYPEMFLPRFRKIVQRWFGKTLPSAKR